MTPLFSRNAAPSSFAMATSLFLVFLALSGVWGGTDPPDLDRYSPFVEMEERNSSLTEKRLWYHDYVCSYSRPCGVVPRKFPSCPVCYNDAHCVDFGDCCPETLLKDPGLERGSGTSTSQVCHSALGSSSVFMVASCPEDDVMSSVAIKCSRPNGTDWRQILPVSSVQTGATYVNKYCALCNDVSNYTLWELEVDCSGPGRDPEVLSRATSVDDLFRTILETRACAMNAKEPPIVEQRYCFQKPGEVISECNVTGSWMAYDVRVERACVEFPLTYYGDFRNVFCFLCNTDMGWKQPDCSKTRRLWSVSLTSILDLRDDESEVRPGLDTRPVGKGRSGCHDNEYLRPATEECRPLVCDGGKYIRNGTCTSIVLVTSAQSYVINLDVILQTEMEVLRGDFSLLLEDVKTELKRPAFASGEFRISTFTNEFRSLSCGEHAVLEMTMTLTINAIANVNIDYSEATLLSSYSDLKVNRGNMLFSLSARLAGITMATNGASSESQEEGSGSGSDLVCETGNSSLVLWIPRDTVFSDYPPSSKPRAIPLTRFLTCRQVELFDGEYRFINDTGELEVETPVGAVKTTVFKVFDDKPRMCLEDYLALFNGTDCHNATACPGNSSTRNMSDSGDVRATTLSPSGLLSFACSLVSLVFLATSFATYVVFKKLRTPTGVCSMSMIAVLFTAQAVYEFGAEQTEIAGLCVALGVLAHYLWLSATFWMNACTFLMFYRLMFPLAARVRLGSRTRVLAFASLYAFLSPAAIVASSMAANLGLHGDLGYGGDICYIKRATTRRLGLALPIGVLVLVNLGLFICTVIHLKRGANISSSKENKIGLYACAKLSVITGLSWTFLYVHEAVGVSGLEYVVVVLFGLYGVVVFWALVMNRHVLALCQAWVKGRKDQITGTSVSSTIRSRHDRETTFTTTTG